MTNSATIATPNHINAASDCAPQTKSLYGKDLNVIPESLDTTRPKVKPGGVKAPVAIPPLSLNQQSGSKGTGSAGRTFAATRPPLSYAETVRKGVIQVQKPVLRVSPSHSTSDSSSSRQAPSVTAEEWTVVRRKGVIQHPAPAPVASPSPRYGNSHSSAYGSNARGKPGQPKGNRARNNQPVAPVKKSRAKKRPRTQNASDFTELPYDKTFYAFLLEDKLPTDIQEIWKQLVGFGDPGKAKIKVDDLKKALKQIGFKQTRAAKGSKYTYAPTKFENNGPTITLHLPHETSVEITEVKNKSKSIKKKYPLMVNTFGKYWRNMSSTQ